MRAFLLVAAVIAASKATATEYGLGCSFPLENEEFTCEKGLLGDKRSVYQTYLDGCNQFFG